LKQIDDSLGLRSVVLHPSIGLGDPGVQQGCERCGSNPSR